MGKIFKKIGKAIKGAGKFIKKHWKKIVIAAVVVFTAGVATVGFTGMSTMFTGLTSGGMSSFMAGLKVAGSTMWAGATAIAGTLGIGPGAQGAAAAAGGVEGVGLFGGHAAAAMGSKSAAAGIEAQLAGTVPGTSSFVGPPASLASKTPGSALTVTPGTKLPNGAIATPGSKVTMPLVQGGAKQVAKKGFMDTVGGGALLTGAMGMASGYMQGKALGEEDPLAFFGVNMNGKDPSFILPGQVNPKTGEPISEEEAKAYNEWYASGNKAGTFRPPEPVPV